MWNKVFEKGNEIVLVSVSRKGEPHAVVAISLGLVDERLLVAACQMNTTLKNIKDTGKVCVVGHTGKEYYRLKGSATLHGSGKYFDLAKKLNKGEPVRQAITITMDEVFDLDKVKKVF
jgi:hypothetical protein